MQPSRDLLPGDDEELAAWPDHPPAEQKKQKSPYRVLRYLWNPVPPPQPSIDPDLDEMSWPERSAEVIGFAALSIEHWLSRGGVLREWLRLNLWLAVLLTLFAVLLVPPITAILEGAAEWTGLGSEIVDNITSAVLRLPPVVLALATLLLLVKLTQRHWQKRRRPALPREDDYDAYQ